MFALSIQMLEISVFTWPNAISLKRRNFISSQTSSNINVKTATSRQRRWQPHTLAKSLALGLKCSSGYLRLVSRLARLTHPAHRLLHSLGKWPQWDVEFGIYLKRMLFSGPWRERGQKPDACLRLCCSCGCCSGNMGSINYVAAIWHTKHHFLAAPFRTAKSRRTWLTDPIHFSHFPPFFPLSHSCTLTIIAIHYACQWQPATHFASASLFPWTGH